MQHCSPLTDDTSKCRVAGFKDSTVCLDDYGAVLYKDEDTDKMCLLAPVFIHAIREHGCATDELLDTLRIMKLSNGVHIIRDHMVKWRRHAYVLSHDTSNLTFVDYF